MHRLSAKELRSRFVSGETSASEIAATFIERIRAVEPCVEAFLHVFETPMLEQARRLDAKRQAREPLGKLAAVPVGIKDIINVQGATTTCGSKFLSNFVAPFDATAVRRIREEDGLLVGKTNLDEFAMGSSCEYSAYKQTKNPWNVALVPGGSSGGSAAAVAAGMATICLGTDTGGSVRLPASFCGISGFKPTYGRVSRYGVVALASSFDQIGPMAYSCEDLEVMMEVIGTHCAKDSTSLFEADFCPVSFAERFGRGFSVGVPWPFLEGLPKESREIFDKGLDHLRSLGASVVGVDLPLLSSSIAVYYILMTAEASTNLARFDGIRYGVRAPGAVSLDEVYDLSRAAGFGDEVKRRILLGTFVLSSGYQEAYYKKAQKVRQLVLDSYERAFLSCDVIATPVTAGGAFAFGAKKDPLSMYLEDIYTVGANLAGLPALSVPCGCLSDGRPVGFQITAAQRRDPEVLAIGRALQGVSQYHHARPSIKGAPL